VQLIRGVAATFAFLATFFFVYWLPFSVLMPERSSDLIPQLGSFTAAVIAATFVWRSLGSVNRGFLASVATGAALLGTIGFVGGFFGPMIFAPQANQGPLLGLFITGPGGFVLGAVGGAAYWGVARSRGGRC
jgi:hypothetical protein